MNRHFGLVKRSVAIYWKVLPRELHKRSVALHCGYPPLLAPTSSHLVPIQPIAWYTNSTSKETGGSPKAGGSSEIGGSSDIGGSSEAGGSSEVGPPKPTDQSLTSRLKVVLREYGTVAVVFHTVISCASLGTCYMIVSSGVDVAKFLKYLHIESSLENYKTASTFAVAYLLHKVFLPLRAFITISSVPFIVRALRARGLMKAPKLPTIARKNKNKVL